jgi:hypothetical protein
MDAPDNSSPMATVLSYAPPERRTLRHYLGPIAIFVAVCSCALVVADTCFTRYELASYVQLPGDRCGTTHASLKLHLYTLPMLFVPCAVAAGVSHHLHYGAAVSRISLCVAVLGWATCAFIG